MSEEDIRRDIANAVPYRRGDARVDDRAAETVVHILPGTAYMPEEIRWLWRDWLALGKLHLLVGTAGTGKTAIALSLAAAITADLPWPDGSEQPGGDVLIWSGEDGIADTLLPRFLAASGRKERIHFVETAYERGKTRPFDPATDMTRLGEAARQLPALRLLVLDPVVSVVTGDSHKNTETRRGLQPVVDLAAELGCAVLGITHLSKNTNRQEPVHRVAGSIAFGAVARIVLATVKPADPRSPRRLVRAKSNLGPDTGGLEYTLFAAPVPDHGLLAQRVDWGRRLDGSARELMDVETPEAAAGALDEAEAFLRNALGDGPRTRRDLETAAEAEGLSWRTVRRAKKKLGIVATKTGYASGWTWRLPEGVTATDDGDQQE
jgi:putative DNA primase/helicase